MKILMITTAMGLGGAETHILSLANELVKRGHTVFLASRGGVMEEALNPRVRRVRIGGSLSPRIAYRDYRLLLHLCREEAIEVIHGHTRAVNLIAHCLYRKTNIPFVSTVHWTFSAKQPKKALSRWGERQLAVSQDIKAYLLEKYATSPDLAACTVNGIDTELFKGARKKEKTLLHISRLDRGRERCADLLLEIAPELAEAGVYERLDIVGDGDCFLRLSELGEEINRRIGRKFIHFYGGRADTESFLEKAACFVGVSRAALEAMAAECRVVLCGNEGYGGIFSPKDAKRHAKSNFCCRGMREATAEALLFDLLRLPTTGGGEENRAFIKKYYTVARMANDAERMYASLPPRKKKRKKATLCGYYGYGNVGDEAMLSVLYDRLTAAGYSVNILSGRPRETKKRHPCLALRRFFFPSVFLSLLFSDLFVLGGGNLLQNESSSRSLLYYASLARIAKLFHKPIWLQSIGIGSYQGDYAKKTIQKTLDICDLAVFRTHADLDKARALSQNPNFFFSPDAALFFPFDRFPKKKRKRPAVAVSLKDEKTLPAALLTALEKEGLDIFFLVMNPKDLAAAKAAARGRTVYIPRSVGEAISLLCGASLALGERLHFAVFSFGLGIPFLSLDASEKVIDFCYEITLAAKRAGYSDAKGIYERGSARDTADTLYQKAISLLSKKEYADKRSAVHTSFFLF